MYVYIVYIFKEKKTEKKSQRQCKLTVVTPERNIISTIINHLRDTMCFQASSCSLICFHHSCCRAALSSEQVTPQKSKSDVDDQATAR